MISSNSSPAERALQWWPTAVPDSALWRWLPLLVAIQEHKGSTLRCMLCDDSDKTSKDLLLNVLGIDTNAPDQACELLIINLWDANLNQDALAKPTVDKWFKRMQQGCLVLILPGVASSSKWTNRALDWIYPGVAVDQEAKPDWLDEIGAHITALMERGLQFQRIADSSAISIRKVIAPYQDQLSQAYQQHSLLLSYEERLTELERSSSWRLTAPLRTLADQLRHQDPPAALPAVPPTFGTQFQTDERSPFRSSISKLGNLEASALLEQKGQRLHQDDAHTVVIVIHEASFTGAPILAWNLARDLTKDHNLVVISLRRGNLEKQLLAICTSLITPAEHNQDFENEQAIPVLKELLAKSPLHWSLTNSIETWRWPKILRQLGVPSVMLIHEFATYSTEPNAFYEACLWASKVVFSSPVTHADMKRVYPALAEVPVELIPQGRCQIPGKSETSQDTILSSARFDLCILPELKQLHSPEWLQQCVVIMGGGTLAPRKGPDLFISVCNAILQRQSSRPILCLWLAGPDKTSDYKSTRMWCDDQIHRSGIEGRVVIIHAHDHYEALMQRADLFLLTSKLDPLPNVTLDALHNGIPTLTFAKASGTASWLERDPWLKKRCVAPYLNIEAMALQADHLINNVDERKEAGARSKGLAEQTFSITNYQQQIRTLGQSCQNKFRQQTDAYMCINAAQIFDPEMGVPPERSESTNNDTAIYNYLQGWERHIQQRKPFAGFHPGLFADHHPKSDADPLCTWLQLGQPKGPWNQPVLSLNEHLSDSSISSPLRVAIHIHVHHLDLCEEILERLLHNQSRPILWISFTDPELEGPIRQRLTELPWTIGDIRCWPNRGRNFGPLLQGLGKELEESCDLFAHLHTKRSPHLNPDFTARWRRFLLDHLIGRANDPIMDQIIAAFGRDSRLGLVYPDDPNCLGWTTNRPSAQKLMDLLNLSATEQTTLMPPQVSSVDFPIGSMFWVRSGCLQRLWGDPWTPDSLPPEPLRTDGTILHSMERLLPALSRHAGWSTAVTHISGSTR